MGCKHLSAGVSWVYNPERESKSSPEVGENQTKIILSGISRTKRKLQALEKENGLESRKFYEEFQSGKLGDDFKYIRWAGEYETLVLLQKDYNDLQDIELCL